LENNMSFVGDLIGDVFGGITGAKQAAKAAERAGATQSAAAQQGINEQRRQFDKFVELMAPYVTAGTGALGGQQALVGLGGAEAQQQAIAGFEGSPQFQALTQQGENAILQNAAATGGLRGGNVQAALAQFRPQVLSDLINQQYARLGGISTMGQNAAVGQAAAGQTLGANVANLFGQQGAATAGGQLARGAVPGQTFGQLLQIGGTIAGMGGFGGGGGAPAAGAMGGGSPNLGYMGGGQGLRPSGSIFG
jgi:hypothetical protein